MAELWRLSAVELADCIRKRSASVTEVVEAHLARIDAVNPAVNAVTVVMSDQAMAQAAQADQQLSAGEATGPLFGVPFTVKENVDVAGTATTWGVQALAGAIADEDAPAVRGLRQAGAIPIGRTNLCDFALRWHTDNGLHGATINPRDPALTPGGSSGGEAVALATGMTPLGVGNDLGGSLRWPSQCNGTAAIRPTFGRVPHATVIEPVDSPIGIQLLNVQGPMARRIADLEPALKAMSTPSARDPWYVPAGGLDSPAGRRRAAVVRNPGGLGVHPAVAQAVERAAESLRSAGYEVVEDEPAGILEAAAAWGALVGADVEGMRPLLGALMAPDAVAFLDIVGAAITPKPAEWAHAFMVRQGLLRAWSMYLERTPVVLAPICTEPPFAVGDDLIPERTARILVSMRMTVAVNLLGLPAVAVPVPGEAGAVQAVQVIGARFRERDCLVAAAAIESILGGVAPVDPAAPAMLA